MYIIPHTAKALSELLSAESCCTKLSILYDPEIAVTKSNKITLLLLLPKMILTAQHRPHTVHWMQDVRREAAGVVDDSM